MPPGRPGGTAEGGGSQGALASWGPKAKAPHSKYLRNEQRSFQAPQWDGACPPLDPRYNNSPQVWRPGCMSGTVLRAPPPKSLRHPRRWVPPSSPHFTGEKTDRFFESEHFLIHTEPSSESTSQAWLKRQCLPRAEQDPAGPRAGKARSPPGRGHTPHVGDFPSTRQPQQGLKAPRTAHHLPTPTPHTRQGVLPPKPRPQEMSPHRTHSFPRIPGFSSYSPAGTSENTRLSPSVSR